MGNDLGLSIRNTLIDFLTPLREAASDQKALIDWLATLGQTEAIAGDPALLEIAQRAQVVIEKLSALDPETLKSWTGLTAILESGKDVAEIQRELRLFAEDPSRSQIAQGLAEEVMSLLLASYLRRRYPTLFRIASLLKLIEPRESSSLDPPLVENGLTIRYPRILDRFKFDSLTEFLSEPGEKLKEAYFPNNMSAGPDAWSAASQLFPNVSFLADEIGLSWRTEYRPVANGTPPPPPPITTTGPETLFDGFDPGNGDEPLAPPPPPTPDEYFAAHHPTLRLKIAGAESANGNGDVALEIRASSRQHPGAVAGFIVSPVGDFNHTETRGSWKLALSASGEVPAFAVGPAGFSLVPNGQPPTSGSAKLLIERLPEEGASGPAFLFGSAEGTRLEMGNLRLAVDLSYAERAALAIGLAATSGVLVIAPGDGDGFLRSILPAEGLQAKFDVGLDWSDEHGLTFRGAGSLDAALPVNLSIGDVLTVPTIHLSLSAAETGLNAEISAGVGVSIGPFKAAIDRVGLAAKVTFPETGGNLGPVDLDFRFKPPTGVGLAIDAPVVVGGGYLSFDPQKGEYSGILQLEIAEKISVKAIGMLVTRMPDGGKGYSLMALVFTEGFAPIQLGFGFTLTGIGGLLGINRTFDENALRSGLKNHTLDSVMFPKDPIRNAPQILSNLNKVFPVARGHHLFGPMLQIAWGTPPLITAELGLVLEIGARRRLLILAQIEAILPKRENDLIRLQMDAVGVIDFDQGTAELDATLHDSRLLKKFVLTGDMAMRLKWKGSPNFALSVGGLHPAFNPPPKFPKLERISISLCSGNNPRIRCEAYYALTSNTVQFGARAELYAEAAGFSIQGDIGYDVLIQFDPFAFLAEFHAQIQLKRGSTNLFKVRVEGALSGPRPLHIKAKATFEILWWDVTIRIDKTLVSGEKPPGPAPIDVMPRLKEALGNPGNWTSQLPGGQRQMVTLRPVTGGATDVLLHPLGSLAVKQNVVPLNLDISRFGQAAPAGDRRFTITSVTVGVETQTPAPIKDFFAPAQFLEMSDDAKLSRPSFEQMTAGVRFTTEGFAITENGNDWLEVGAIEYETVIVEKKGSEPRRSDAGDPKNMYRLSAERLEKQAQYGAAANSEIRRTGTAKYRATIGKYKVRKEGWSVVSEDGMSERAMASSEGEKPTSYSEVAEALRKLKQANPAQAVGLKILRLSELSTN